MNKTKKSAKVENTTDNSTAENNETIAAATETEKPAKIQKKRSIPYSLSRIDRITYGPASLTKE